ncbi:LuxR C-terminal-related transcriptional regulator [Solibacillus sp. FSL K6-1781]|uniref:LuxR C-terminal-related transcriptional regulator n=1 Tax=Solibacillus sp. FSL K6-1781 TaxID=2921474 RepID=UPI00315A0EA2
MAKHMVNRHTLDQMIKDYHWMIKIIKEAETDKAFINGIKVASYGIESTLPKASGGTSDPVFYEVHRRTQFSSLRIQQYCRKILEVQKRIPLVVGDREIEVLHRLLDGDSMRSIGKHMNLSSTTIFRIRNDILNQMIV